MNNKQLAEALRAIDMSALPIKDRAAVLNAAEALEIGEAQAEALKADAERCRGLRIASVSNNADFSEAMLIAVPEDVRKGRRNMTESEWNVSIDFAISAANKGDCHE